MDNDLRSDRGGNLTRFTPRDSLDVPWLPLVHLKIGGVGGHYEPVGSGLRQLTNRAFVMRTTLADSQLVVSTDGTAGPYIIVTPEQLKPVTQALQAQNIPFETDDDAVMLDGRPALLVIDLGHNADIDRVQSLLDDLAASWPREEARHSPPPTQNELIVRFSPSDSPQILERLEAEPPAGWTRRRDIEDRMRKMRAAKAGAYCFTKRFAPSAGEVAVWLETRGSSELYVSTIIALKSRETMGVDRYNQVLEDFEATFIEPLMDGLKRHVFNYQAPREPILEDVLSTELMRRLRAFSAAANKGMPHPLDMHRWQVFIARAHLEDAVIEPSLLSDWLQGDGWPEAERSRLIDEFQFGRALLSVFDEERADR